MGRGGGLSSSWNVIEKLTSNSIETSGRGYLNYKLLQWNTDHIKWVWYHKKSTIKTKEWRNESKNWMVEFKFYKTLSNISANVWISYTNRWHKSNAKLLQLFFTSIAFI